MIIVGLFLDKIATNKTFDVKGNNNINSAQIMQFNKAINDFHKKVWNIFNKHVIKSSFNLKKEVISSLTYGNLSTEVKKVKIQSTDLIGYLKLLNLVRKTNQTHEVLNLNNYNLFSALFEENGALKVNIDTEKLPTITLFLDTRCMLKPQKFIDHFSKELRLPNGIEQENIHVNYTRCTRCHLILPKQFILGSKNDSEESCLLFKSFTEKVHHESLLLICDIIRDTNFPKDKAINSVENFLNALFEFIDRTKDDLVMENAYKVRIFVEELLAKVDLNYDEDELFKYFTESIFKHIKKQFKHVDFIASLSKVLNDINDAIHSFNDRINNINNDIDKAIASLSFMKNSVEVEMRQALHRKLKLRNYTSLQNEVTYSIVISY
jgi:hypothetical protein